MNLPLAQLTVGALVTTRPRAVAVLQRNQLDFCCGGHRSLAEACAQRDLDPEAILDEVSREEARWDSPAVRWDERPMAELIEHILNRHHRPMEEELPRLQFMAGKVHRVHGDKDPRIHEIAVLLSNIREDLEAHMGKEERVLFPLILVGRGALASQPVHVICHEHDAVGGMLRRMRALTDDYTPPEGACGTWRALWQGLADLEADLHQHIHLENNILFPRALAS